MQLMLRAAIAKEQYAPGREASAEQESQHHQHAQTCHGLLDRHRPIERAQPEQQTAGAHETERGWEIDRQQIRRDSPERHRQRAGVDQQNEIHQRHLTRKSTILREYELGLIVLDAKSETQFHWLRA